MKKVLTFFAGMILLLLMFVVLYVSGLIYNAGDDRKIGAFVFQPNNLSTQRIGKPVTIDDLSEKFIRERLIKKFVTEYFYVTPDPENIALRTRPDSILAALSSPDVFREWRNGTAIDIESMAQKKVLRRVTVANEILKPENSDYWLVVYELKTWDSPNNFAQTPTIEKGVMYLDIDFEKGIRPQRGGQDFDVQQYLDDGGDPAAIFKFRVNEVRK